MFLFCRPTDGLVTATEAAAADLSLKTLVAEAKPAAHRSITTFAALRDDVYAELTNIDKVRIHYLIEIDCHRLSSKGPSRGNGH